MRKTLLACFLVLGATAFAAGNTYKVTLFQDSVVEGKTLKAGDYKISVENGNAVIKWGRNNSVEVPARAESDANKFGSTVVLYKGSADVTQIRVGGTHTKIVFEGATPMQTGQ